MNSSLFALLLNTVLCLRPEAMTFKKLQGNIDEYRTFLFLGLIVFATFSNAAEMVPPAPQAVQTKTQAETKSSEGQSLSASQSDTPVTKFAEFYHSELMSREDIFLFPSGESFQSPFSLSAHFVLSNEYSDALVDADGDGVPDYLSIRTKINFTYAGSYGFSGYLADNSGKPFISASTSGAAAAGENTIELRFDAKQLRSHGANGAFRLVGVSLITIDKYRDGHLAVGKYGSLFETQSYDLQKTSKK